MFLLFVVAIKPLVAVRALEPIVLWVDVDQQMSVGMAASLGCQLLLTKRAIA